MDKPNLGKAPPLPARSADLYQPKRARNLNDRVNDAFLRLFDQNERFRDLFRAIWDSEAVEKSLRIDYTIAAQMLRAVAQKEGDGVLSHTDLHSIQLSLNVVLRRHKIHYKQRRNLVGEEIVPDNGE